MRRLNILAPFDAQVFFVKYSDYEVKLWETAVALIDLKYSAVYEHIKLVTIYFIGRYDTISITEKNCIFIQNYSNFL